MKRLWIMGTVLLSALMLSASPANAGMSVWQWLGLGFGPGYHASSGGHHGHRAHGYPTFAAQPHAGQPTPSLPSVSGTRQLAVPQSRVISPPNAPSRAATAPQALPWRGR